MNDPAYLKDKFRTANEPKVHPLVKRGFVFVHSAGMRLAPEILVLELMREVFFESHYGDTPGNRDLDPEEQKKKHEATYSDEERAVLYALRGRRKKSKAASTLRFFAPAYPSLARSSWLGKSREHVINNFLLSGPIAQHLWHRGPDSSEGLRQRDQIVGNIITALIGHNSCLDETLEGKDILAATLGPESFASLGDIPGTNLEEKTGYSNSVMKTEQDELASRIAADFNEICCIEKEMPRMQWLHVLMTYLRFALPMWLLAQTQITRLLHAWMIQAFDQGLVLNTDTIKQTIAKRNRGLLQPTLVATRELFDHIEGYMKCRIEVNILLYCLQSANSEPIEGKRLVIEKGSSDTLGLEELLILIRDNAGTIRNSDRYKNVAQGLKLQTFLTREGEQFSAWRNPLAMGQSKNMDEFFRVLYKADLGDEEGGYLLTSEGRGQKRGFRVFPGQLLLKVATFLAARDRVKTQAQGGGGKLVLDDVEAIFSQYGIDFSKAADARPMLMRELQAMGLLTGSPDAGGSVAVTCPF